jgi:aldose 1-epimerase
MPYSSRFLVGGDDAVPTGKIDKAAAGSIDDFASKPGIQLGHSSGSGVEFSGHCGAGGRCEGYNGYWLIEDAPADAVVVSLASPFSGIKADMKTNQPGVVIYTCNWFSGVDQELKTTQLGVAGRQNVTRSSCVAIEAQDYPDGVNRYVSSRHGGPIMEYYR